MATGLIQNATKTHALPLGPWASDLEALPNLLAEAKAANLPEQWATRLSRPCTTWSHHLQIHLATSACI